MILRGSLAPDPRAAETADPTTVFNLINVDDDASPLPDVQNGRKASFDATIPHGYSSPLTASTYNLQFQEWPSLRFPLALAERSAYWFSTGNLLNSPGPCASS